MVERARRTRSCFHWDLGVAERRGEEQGMEAALRRRTHRMLMLDGRLRPAPSRSPEVDQQLIAPPPAAGHARPTARSNQTTLGAAPPRSGLRPTWRWTAEIVVNGARTKPSRAPLGWNSRPVYLRSGWPTRSGEF